MTDLDLLICHEEGATQAQLARRLGLSRQRVHQRIASARRELVVDAYEQGLAPSEIAEALSLPVASVERLISAIIRNAIERACVRQKRTPPQGRRGGVHGRNDARPCNGLGIRARL